MLGAPQKLDLIILIGAGGQNRQADFSVLVLFVKQLTSNLIISPDKVRVGIVSYGKTSKIIRRLSSLQLQNQLQSVLSVLTLQEEGFNAEELILLFKNDLFLEANENAHKAILFFATDDNSDYAKMEKLLTFDAKFVVVGYGSNVEPSSLLQISSVKSSLFLPKTAFEIFEKISEVQNELFKPGIFLCKQLFY